MVRIFHVSQEAVDNQQIQLMVGMLVNATLMDAE